MLGVDATAKVPQGQPGMRKAWVERAFVRQQNGASPAQRLGRISEGRRGYYACLVELMQRARASGKRVILDSGCGTGESTRQRICDECWILGVDKSLARMDRGAHQGLEVPVWRQARALHEGAQSLALKAGGLLARAELGELVLTMYAQGCAVDQMDFLYPNPWPKTQHFGRRWYGHPIWPFLLAVSQDVQLRTNWEVYAQEFAVALGLWVPQDEGQGQCQPWSVQPQDALTAFERKYSEAGHPLFRVVGRGGAREGTPGPIAGLDPNTD